MLPGRYLDAVQALVRDVLQREMAAIRRAAGWCAESRRSGKQLWHLDIGHFPPFETARERAGNPRLFEPLSYRLDEVQKIGRGDVVVFGSILGVFALSVDICLSAKEKGAKVVYIGSPVAVKIVPPQHPSGRRVADVADLVIRTHVPYTDGVLKEPWLPTPACPLSGFANAMIYWMLNAEVLRLLDTGKV